MDQETTVDPDTSSLSTLITLFSEVENVEQQKYPACLEHIILCCKTCVFDLKNPETYVYKYISKFVNTLETSRVIINIWNH